MASIKSISVRDLTGLANIGGAGETATVVLTLDEAVTVTNGTINFASVTPTFQVGATVINPSNISFVGYNPSAKTISYNVVIPSNQALSGALSLTSISLNNITITGKKGASLSSTVSLTSNYIIDNTMPVFRNTTLSNTINENSPARTPLFTATATDSGSGIASYRLTGTDASLFNVDARGVVRFKVAPNFETKSQYGLNVVAVDRAGNSNAQALTVYLNNVDEAVTLARGVTGVGNITLSSGNLANQGRSILADFSNNSTSNNPLTFTTGTVKGIPNFSVANGILSGTATAGSYRFTAQSVDGSTTNGRDASRSYNLVIVDKPSVTGIQVIDSDNTGRAGNVVTIKVILSEAINPLTGTPNITANFTAGRNTFTGSFSNVSTENGVSVLNFNAALPAGDSNSISLTTLSLGSTALTGVLTAGTTTSTQSRINQSTTYLLDNTAPRITSPASINVNENAQGVIYTATATDLNAVRYSITGAEASLFSMDANTGRLSVVGSLDYEALKSSNYRVSLTVTATDSNGNFSARPIVVNVRDVNEASVLSKGQATLTDFNLYKIIDATSYITPINADVADPEGRPLTYRISDGWLPAGLTLNTKTGAVTGKPTGNDGAAYNFTITADDGVFNGTDASRSYSGSITSKIALSAADRLISATENATLTVQGVFSVGGTVQLYRVGTGGAADTAVGTLTTLGVVNTESVQHVVNRTDLMASANGNADFYVRYISGGTTLDSITLNITRDETNPSVSALSLSSAGVSNSIVNAGDVVTASVTYSEAVQVSGTPTIDLLINTTTRAATYSNTNGNVVNFIYTIQAGDNDTNGIAVRANSLALTATNKISDLAGNTASNGNAALTDQSGFKVDTRIAQGFVINGDTTYDRYQQSQGVFFDRNDRTGLKVSSAGDINGDGLTDILVSANLAKIGSVNYAGRVYLIFGKKSATPVNVADVINGTGGFVINAFSQAQASSYLVGAGDSISNVGDVNGDGLNDLLIGSTNDSSNSRQFAGKAYVVFGKTDTSAISLSNIEAGNGGFAINSESANIYTGIVSAASDINGDGLADLLISSLANNSAGRNYIIFGKTDTTPINLSNVVAGSGGFVINGECSGDSSVAISSAGDVNGDGLADLIIGASGKDISVASTNLAVGSKEGRSYVVFGRTNNTNIDLSALVSSSNTLGFVINGQGVSDQSGSAVSGAGDVNGDGLADLIVGASNSDPFSPSVADAGRSYVVFGKTSGSGVDLSAIAGGASTLGFVINGGGTSDLSGFSVSAAGDVNGDGYADLIVGAYLADNSTVTDTGRSYVVFGKPSGSEVNLTAVANGIGGFVINGFCAGDWSGFSVSSASDVNGDGLADLIVGAPVSDRIGYFGRTYIIFGKTDTQAINLSDISSGNGAIVNYANTPTAGNDTFSGSTAGEIILGAAGNDTLIGGGGADVLLGGAGNDVLIINASNISQLMTGPVMIQPIGNFQLARVDGGTGIDTLQLSGAGNLDLTQISQVAASNPNIGSRISSIEKIDLNTDTAGNRLTLKLVDVLDMTGMNLFNSGNGWTGLTAQVARHQLVINGGSGDTVDIADTGSGTGNWTSGATVTNGGVSYVIWNHNTAAAQLLVQQGVGVI